MIIYLKYFLIFPIICQAADILVVVPIETRSHMNVFTPVIEELSKKHQITLITIIPLKHHNENVTQIVIKSPKSDVMDFKTWLAVILKDQGAILEKQFYNLVSVLSTKHWLSYMTNPEVVELVKSGKKFDLMILDGYFCDSFLILTEQHKTPVIIMTPSVRFPWINEMVGNPINHIMDPVFYFSTAKLTLADRLRRTISGNIVNIYWKWVTVPALNNVNEIAFPWIEASIEEMQKRVVMVMSNLHPAMGYTSANVPGIIDIGGVHINPPKPLPKELDEFIAKAGDHGFIYFSLGASLPGLTVVSNMMNTLLNVFRQIPQRVIWKIESNITDIPENVHMSPWLPQQDILGDKRIKAFITQAGISSLQEAAYHGVPVLCLPVMLDQFVNTGYTESSGYGIGLDIANITYENFLQSLNKLVNDTKYSTNARHISSLMQDEPMTARQRAVWWIEYVLRHKNVEHLKSPLVKLPWYQSNQFDVFLILNLVFVLCVVILFYVLKSLFKITILIIRMFKNKKEKIA